jgi:phosphoglycerol transferase MdoB-like AlkP superfamily enzyme
MKKFKLPFYITFLLPILFYGMLSMSILRLFMIFFVSTSNKEEIGISILEPIRIGLQFDAVIMAYILVLPFVLLAIMHFARKNIQPIRIFLVSYFSIILPLLLFIILEDIPYFNFFRNRLTESAFQWLNTPGIVLQMVLGSLSNSLFLLVAIFSVGGLAWYVFKKCSTILRSNHWIEPSFNGRWLSQILLLVLAFTVCFIGLRGKIARPIRQGDAFFGNDPLLNQMGLNPAYTLIKSYTDKVNLMNNEEALYQSLKWLGIHPSKPQISPIYRQVVGSNQKPKYNIVLVLMESMSGNYMATFGNKQNLTPNLDSLTKCSWFFDQGYSAGIHTNNGIFSSLYSFPALKRNRPMAAIPTREYSGLPFALKEKGYYNIFFSSHDESFDNLSTFIPVNHFNKLFSAKDYPQDKLIGTFGVPDDYLFQFASDELSKQKQPFFATILTTSNHDPYDIPEYFKTTQTEIDLKGVNYADWSIGVFLKKAHQKNWFNNTIFVFVSDHGLVVGENPYDLTLSYHHIPFIIHAPGILSEPKTIHNYIEQIDLFPTLMGLMDFSYQNNTLGVDILKEPRPFAYFSADNKIGCLNKEWLYVYRFDGGGESLYHYANNDLKDYINEPLPIKDSLKSYALSQIQTAEYLYSKDLTKIKKPE